MEVKDRKGEIKPAEFLEKIQNEKLVNLSITRTQRLMRDMEILGMDS